MRSVQEFSSSATPSQSHLSPSSTSLTSSLTTSPDHNLPPITPEYLQELLKDKRNLHGFSGSFHHIDRILEAEISRARSALYHQNGSSTRQHSDDLPQGEGPVVTVQEKVFIPVKDNPNYNFVGRLLGPRGMTAKQLESDLDCKIMVRGIGSMRDKKKEEQNRGKPNWEHLTEELHVLVCVEDHQNRAEIKAKRAANEIRAFLEQAVKMPSGADDIKRRQLLDLAVFNGTFRSASGKMQLPCEKVAKPSHVSNFQLAATYLQASRASALSMAAAAAAAASSSGQLPQLSQNGAAAAAFLRLPQLPGLPGPTPHQFMIPGQQQQQHQLLGFPIMQQQQQQAVGGSTADLSAYLMAAAAAAAAGTSTSGQVPTSAADQAAMLALMYPGAAAGIQFGGESGPMKSRQGGTAGLRPHPYSR